MNPELVEFEMPSPMHVLGNDIVYMPDFRKSFNRLFADKVYTAQEKAYCNRFTTSMLRFASTWAAKEASYKALKQAFPDRRYGFKKIEIVRHAVGQRPNLVLAGSSVKASLSISHAGEYVWATCLIDRNDIF